MTFAVDWVLQTNYLSILGAHSLFLKLSTNDISAVLVSVANVFVWWMEGGGRGGID